MILHILWRSGRGRDLTTECSHAVVSKSVRWEGKKHLPDELQASVAATMRQAYAMRDYKKAKQQLENLARRLDEEHPSAAASVREGIGETLIVIKLGLPATFARTFATTNPIENLNG